MRKILMIAALFSFLGCNQNDTEKAQTDLDLLTIFKPQADSLYIILDAQKSEYAQPFMDKIYFDGDMQVISLETIQDALINDSTKWKLYNEVNTTASILCNAKAKFLSDVTVIPDSARNRMISDFKKLFPPLVDSTK